jgi:outer membrane protein assembly factor BamB
MTQPPEGAPPPSGPLRRAAQLSPRWPAAILGLVIAIAAGLALVHGRDATNSDPNAAFSARELSSDVAQQNIPKGNPSDDGFRWPVFGGNPQRTNALKVVKQLSPPYTTVWARRGAAQLEFPPVSCGRSLYLLRNDGVLIKLSRRTGVGEWKRKLGHLAASSPACSATRVYVTLLERGKGVNAGRVVALDTQYGHTVWSRKLRGRSESSPLLWRDRLYLGTEDGSVISLRTRDGALRWRQPTDGAVKGAVAMNGGKLYVGDYSGRVYAMRRSDGKVIWVRRPTRGGFSLTAGSFYSGAAIAYGRLYIGSTDGGVYSLSLKNGNTAWRAKTKGYVYGSPAVGSPGGRPTVFIGSYDKSVYALDAQTGRVRWRRSLGGKISGTATLVGDTLWIASLGRHMTFAINAKNGRVEWQTARGEYTPVISDGRRIYLNGATSIFGLDGQGVRFERGKSPVPPSTDPVLSKDPALRARLSGRKARTEAQTGKTSPPLTTTPLTSAKKVTGD